MPNNHLSQHRNAWIWISPQTGDFLSRRRDDEDLPFLAAMTARHIPTLQGTYQAIEGAAVFPQHLGDQNQG
jgi:hypothetical protein